jgi:hypothetical protein
MAAGRPDHRSRGNQAGSGLTVRERLNRARTDIPSAAGESDRAPDPEEIDVPPGYQQRVRAGDGGGPEASPRRAAGGLYGRPHTGSTHDSGTDVCCHANDNRPAAAAIPPPPRFGGQRGAQPCLIQPSRGSDSLSGG